MKSIDLAYIAGLLDGEGCFTLRRCARGKFLHFQPEVILTLTQKEPINWVHKTLGVGHIYNRVKLTKGWRKAFWVATTSLKDTKKLIKLVLPYLKVKKEVAKLLLYWCENHKRAPRGLAQKYTPYQVPDWEIEIFNQIQNIIHPSFGI